MKAHLTFLAFELTPSDNYPSKNQAFFGELKSNAMNKPAINVSTLITNAVPPRGIPGYTTNIEPRISPIIIANDV